MGTALQAVARFVMCGALFAALPGAAQEPATLTAPALTAKVWTDRTTLYPGDRVWYVARVEHPAEIEFVRDHVRKDQLSLDPFEILDVNSVAGDMPGGRRFFEVRLLLTTYETGHPEATIPAFNLFYFRRGQQADKGTTPAETLVVPALKLGLRSTLVDPGGSIRDYKPVSGVAANDWRLPGIAGIAGIAAVLLYGSSLIVAWVRSGIWKRKAAAQTRHKPARESFDEIRYSSLDSREDVEKFYTKASLILREIATERLGDCNGLTPRELEQALRKMDAGAESAPAVSAPAVCALMEQCDLMRYSPDAAGLARSGQAEFLRKLEEVVGRQ
jgi:hypothetical protein